MSSLPRASQRKVAVAILSPTLAPYRIPVFNRLAQIPFLDLDVFFATNREHAESWTDAAAVRNFSAHLLPSRHLPVSSELGDTSALYFTPGVWHALTRGQYDVVVTLGWTTPNSAVALAHGKIYAHPVVLWEESIPHAPSRAKRVLMPFIKRYIHSFNGVLAASNACIKYMVSIGAAQDRVTLLPQVVDNSYFAARSKPFRTASPESKRALGVSTPELILFVGQLSWRKGVLTLLEAFRRLAVKNDNVSLMLVGQGPLEAELLKRRVEYGLEKRVIVHGHASQTDLPGIYGAADVFVLPSLYDTFGVVICEAMACGLPIITTPNVGAVSSIVKDGVNGIVVNPDSVDELAAALEQVQRSQAMRLEMGAASRRIIADWDLELAARNFSQAILKCLPERVGKLVEANEDCPVQ
jgi:glycosyltransferase involved in cell wall biosynthesis